MTGPSHRSSHNWASEEIIKRRLCLLDGLDLLII